MSAMKWNLTRWEPLKELKKLQEQLDEVFDLVPFKGGIQRELWAPEVDVSENDKNIVVEADIPGVKKENLVIKCEEDSLALKGKKEETKEIKGKNFHQIERSYGSFHRVVRLPHSVDSKKAKASYKEGVLKVIIPKKEQTKEKGTDIKVE